MRLAAAAAIVVVAAAAFANAWRSEAALRQQVMVEQKKIAELETRMNAAQVDWPAISAKAELSVVTVAAGDFLGSGWVAHADAKSSEIITNFHVIADAWSNGSSNVEVRQGDSTWSGTIVRVDRNDDLAVIRVSQHLAALTYAPQRPHLGSTVMAIGSSLGLDGTISIGVVSGYRSIEGSNYMQFSAPISPGNSGGPVLDARGRVVGIATAKLVYPGAEGLSLAIPVGMACENLVVCSSQSAVTSPSTNTNASIGLPSMNSSTHS